jgi:hypothetical protein
LDDEDVVHVQNAHVTAHNQIALECVTPTRRIERHGRRALPPLGRRHEAGFGRSEPLIALIGVEDV